MRLTLEWQSGKYRCSGRYGLVNRMEGAAGDDMLQWHVSKIASNEVS